jgi:hypothetical protein
VDIDLAEEIAETVEDCVDVVWTVLGESVEAAESVSIDVWGESSCMSTPGIREAIVGG